MDWQDLTLSVLDRARSVVKSITDKLILFSGANGALEPDAQGTDTQQWSPIVGESDEGRGIGSGRRPILCCGDG